MFSGTLIEQRYELLEETGRGGSGSVHRARDRQTGALVAVKILGLAGQLDLERFQRESSLLAQLRHPNIVTYVGHGESEDGRHFLVQEWVAGGTLRQRMRTPPGVSAREAVAAGLGVAEALAAAHALDVVHRDVKPENILLTGSGLSQIKLADFGIARLTDPGTRLTRTGMLIGTPAYMSPEQARGSQDIGPPSDVWGLGCVLYEMLGGRPPFDGQPAEIRAKVILQDPADLSLSCPEAPGELIALVSRMLAKSSSQRPANASEVVHLLRELAVPDGPRRTNAAPNPGAPARRGRAPEDPETVNRVMMVGAIEELAQDTVTDHSRKLRMQPMRPRLNEEWTGEPVCVTERIPANGPHGISPEELEREGIPTPAHLQVLGELGRGSMGRVHPATDRNLLRHVALKCLDRSLSTDPFFRDCFVAEAQITGQLEHPNIPPVYELAMDARGIPYFTMKLVQGRSLDDWLHDPERAPGSSERLEMGLEILVKVCDAVAYAHHRGVIHRDLKPSNVMVAGFGQVYVMDWGLARLMRTGPSCKRPARDEKSGLVGTLEYMSPEQALGNPGEIDERTDVFGIGALLYEVLSGKLPYGSDCDQDGLLERVCKGAVVPIDAATQGLGISAQIRAIAHRATHPDVRQRYQTVLELRDELQGFLRRGMHLPRRSFPKGSLIIREQDAGDAAFIITSGTCRVYRSVGDQEETLAMLGPGEVFGEMALLLDEVRVASVEAVTAVSVLVLSKDTISEELGAGWAGALVRALARRFHDMELEVWSSRSLPGDIGG